jgi:hypothetical protein
MDGLDVWMDVVGWLVGWLVVEVPSCNSDIAENEVW